MDRMSGEETVWREKAASKLATVKEKVQRILKSAEGQYSDPGPSWLNLTFMTSIVIYWLVTTSEA